MKRIIDENGSESNAYCYLGNVAFKIFNTFELLHIPYDYYQFSIKLDSENIEAHWGIFNTGHDIVSLLVCIKLLYKSGNKKSIGTRLTNAYYITRNLNTLEKDDMLFLKEVLEDDDVECHYKYEYLISIYFYLGESDKSIELMESVKYVSVFVIKEMFNSGAIDKKYALSKLFDFEISIFFEDDYEQIFQEFFYRYSLCEEKEKVVSSVISSAFKAKRFDSVISICNENQLNKILADNKLYLIFYISNLFVMNEDIDLDVLAKIKGINSRDNEVKILRKIFLLKKNINLISRQLERDEELDCDIEHYVSYIDSKSILDSSAMNNHFLYADLSDELKNLEMIWNAKFYRRRFDEIKTMFLNGGFDEKSFMELVSYSVECSEFSYLIDIIKDLHSKIKPTMTTLNALGVAYQRLGKLKEAFKEYEHAIELMIKFNQKNHVVIGNYIETSKLLSNVSISKDKVGNLKKLFNDDISNHFKWNTFIANRRSTLFKYSYFNINTIDSLINGYFYLSSREQLNDPVEMPTLERIGGENLIDSDYKICSFSNNINSMLMWSHYADEHKGILVEYWFGGEFPDGFGIDKVTYSDEFIRNRERDLYVFNQYLLTKNSDWSYENEVRIFSCKSNKVNYENYTYPNVDREKINAKICSITLGYKFPSHKKDLVCKIINSMNQIRKTNEDKVVLKEAYMDEGDHFALKYRIVDI